MNKIVIFFSRIRKNWEKITLVLSIIVTGILYILMTFVPSIQVDKTWMFSSGYAGLIALVFLLLDVHNTISQKIEKTTYQNLKEAEPMILNTIKSVAHKRRKEPVQIKILANRLSRVSIIVSDIIRMADEGNLGHSKFEIVVYHTDGSSMPSRYIPAPRDAITEDKHRSYLESLLSNIKWVEKSASESSFVNVSFIKCAEIPYFYSYLIDDNYLYWGYFKWDENVKDWVGPSNKCNYVEKGKDSMLMIDWIINRMRVFDGLYSQSSTKEV